MKPGTGGAAALWLALMALAPTACAEVEVTLEEAPGVVRLPDNWRPIPRAEIVEARERAAQAQPGVAPPPLPTAAFQRLPTLQWFSLPHALVFWQPGGTAEQAQDAASADGAAAAPGLETPAPDLRLSELPGRGPHGLVVHRWQCQVRRHDGHFVVDLLTLDDDGRAQILGLAAGLREVGAQPTQSTTSAANRQ